jgi:aspartate aminotransferase
MSLSLNTTRLSAVKPSATLEMSRKAKALKAGGADVKILSAGEPDMGTPACIIDVAHKAILAGATRYTPARGTAELVEAIQFKYQRDQHVEYDAEEVMGTVGTKGGLMLAIDAMVGEGDEVIVFSPYWVTYPDLIRLAGGTPVIVETSIEDGWQPDPAKLKAALTDRTKLVILNAPTNPTGAGIDADRMKALMACLEGTDVWVLSDEIYERLTYDGYRHVSPIQISDDAKSRTLVCGGVAKAYAMTGWRLGVAAGPKPLIDAMILLQQQRVSCPAAPSQAAAAYALKEPPEVKAAADEMLEAFTRRRNNVVEQLRAIDGVDVVAPQGTFYIFATVPGRFPAKRQGVEIADDMVFASMLLEESHVAVVPGTPFGSPGGFRISFAAADDVLEEGIARIATFLGSFD